MTEEDNSSDYSSPPRVAYVKRQSADQLLYDYRISHSRGIGRMFLSPWSCELPFFLKTSLFPFWPRDDLYISAWDPTKREKYTFYSLSIIITNLSISIGGMESFTGTRIFIQNHGGQWENYGKGEGKGKGQE